MGLLDRLRPGRDERVSHEGTEQPYASSSEPEQSGPEGVYDDDAGLIRPTTLNPPPGDWADLPPIQTTLQEMPLIVPSHFEESLPARRIPEKFLDTLGHAVTESGPAGMVEAVLTPITALHVEVDQTTVFPEPAAADPEAPLPLAPSAHHTRSEDPTEEVRRLPDSYLAELGIKPPPVASGGPPAMVEPTPAPPSPLTHAVAPNDLPLASLSAEPLTDEFRQALAEAAAQAEVAAAAPAPDPALIEPTDHPSTSGLVGDRALSDAAPVVTNLQPLEPPSEPSPSNVAPDLPLATSAAGPTTPDTQVWRIDRGVDEHEEPVGSPVGLAPQGQFGPDGQPGHRVAEPEPEPQPAGPPAAHAPAPSPTGPETHASPEAQTQPETHGPTDTEVAGDSRVAPVLGQSEPVVPIPPAAPVGAVEAPPEPPNPTGSQPLPLAVPPTNESEAIAPTLGGAFPGGPRAPISALPPRATPASAPSGRPEAASPEPGVTAPPRSGLGAPLTGLPPTARSYDITSLSRNQQMEIQRALLRSHLANQTQLGQPDPLAGAAMMRLPRQAPGPAVAERELPLVSVEPLPVRLLGTMPEELEEEGADTAPVLAALPPLIEPAEPETAVERTEPLEGSAVRTAVGLQYNVDLGDIRVDRSPRGSSEAHQMGARAFTSDDRVVIPRGAGSLDAGDGAALFAHELTHVAQRRALGSSVPEESSTAGQVLEAQARHTEMLYARNAGTPPNFAEADPTVWTEAMPLASAAPAPVSLSPSSPAGSSLSRFAPSAFASDAAAPAGATPAQAGLPLAAGLAAGATIDTEAIAQSVIERLSAVTNSAPRTEVFTASSPSLSSLSPGGPVQRAEAATSAPPAAGPSVAPPPETANNVAERPSDDDLNNLSGWLYPLIKYRLKRDLREERERAGLLTEHYRRW